MPPFRELRILDRDYPGVLRELASPPDPLCIWGELLPAPAVAIVGTRTPSEPARLYAHTLAYRLAKRGVTVWSGGAVGIDAAAHRGALDAGGITVAVIGTGLHHCYPSEHAALYAEMVVTGGAVVSPFSLAQPARQFTFTQRNGVLAALTQATVMVQARLRSGARSTARYARRLGRPLFVVPSYPWDDLGEGNLAEIALGARVLCDESRLWDAAGVGSSTERERARTRPIRAIAPPLEVEPPDARAPEMVSAVAARWRSESEPPFESPHCADVFRATCPRPRHFDDLCAETNLGAPLVQQALLTLTLQAVLVEGPAGWYRRVSS